MDQNLNHPKLKPSVRLIGTAKEGTAGPALGHVDIGTNDDAFIFRVSLPGIRRSQSNFKCEIKKDGSVNIRGVVTSEGEILKDSSSVYQMSVQQLCPDGEFGVSFKLPGPVDPRLFSPNFRADGILEGVILRHKIAGTPKDA